MGLFEIIIKTLTFRITRSEMLDFKNKHLILGIIGTWVVGMGRYWDDPTASLLQHLGIGSVIYIFGLSLFIWIILKPFLIEKWTYFTVLTFISLTSFPAIFYAIPVEKFYSITTANSMNAWFLAVVALWRLALLFYFLRVFTKLSFGNIVTVTLMPMSVIISTLFFLNLHHVVFNIMSGIRNPSPHDASYMILMNLTILSVLTALPLLIAYAIGINNRRKSIKKA